MNPKLWFALCLLFGAYNLRQLIDDYFLLNYMIVEPGDLLYNNQTNYLLCTQFEEIGSKNALKFRPDAADLRNATPAVLLNYSILAIEQRMGESGLFQLNQSFVVWDKVCFLLPMADPESGRILERFSDHYAPIFFIFSDTKRPFFFEYDLYRNKNNRVTTIFLKIQKQTVFAGEYLARPAACAKLANQFASSRFACLNKCFIRFGLHIGFYGYEDSGGFDMRAMVNEQSLGAQSGKDKLKKSLTQKAFQPKQKQIKKPIKFIQSQYLLQGFNNNFDVCLLQCPDFSCFYEISNAVRIRRFYYERFLSKLNIDKIDLQSFAHVAYYSTSDWYLQFFGLLTLFANTSIFDVTCLVVVRLAKALGKEQHRCFVSMLRPFKALLVAFAVVFIFVQSTWMLQDYRFRSAYPNRTNILKFTSKFEPFSIVVCFPVETIIYHHEEIAQAQHYQFAHNDELLKSWPLAKLRSLTDHAMKNKTTGLFLFYGFVSKQFVWKVKENIISFRNITCGNRTCLARCFWVEILLEQTKYDLPSNSLSMIFVTHHWQVCLPNSVYQTGFTKQCSGLTSLSL